MQTLGVSDHVDIALITSRGVLRHSGRTDTAFFVLWVFNPTGWASFAQHKRNMQTLQYVPKYGTWEQSRGDTSRGRSRDPRDSVPASALQEAAGQRLFQLPRLPGVWS